MNRLMRAAAIGAALVFTASCSSISAVPPGPLQLGAGHQARLERQWSDVTALMPQRQKGVRVLTVDGPLLNRLYLAQGLEPGQGLIRGASKEKPAPAYHADMSVTEQVEFITDSIAALGYQRISTSRLRPAVFGGQEALRFDFSALTESGLEISGTTQVAQSAGKLYAIIYIAPSEHYFAAYLPDVESLLNSAG